MLLKCCIQYVSKLGKLTSGHRTEKGQFIFNHKKEQCQRMLKLLHNCSHFTCQQGNAPNPSSQALAVHELRTSRCTSLVQKTKRNQRSNCQHLLNYRESKEIPENIYFCFTAAAAAAATAVSLQSCLTLCDPIDGSPPGSAVQARTVEWVAIPFSSAGK